MPNGNPNFEIVELPALERFYAPVARALEGFAVDHNLQLEKYYKHTSTWLFEFRHPAGGVANVQVLNFTDDSVLVSGFWSIPDFEAFTRRRWSAERLVVPRDGDPVVAALTESLHRILALQIEDAKPDGVDYRDTWQADNIPPMRESISRLPLPIP